MACMANGCRNGINQVQDSEQQSSVQSVPKLSAHQKILRSRGEWVDALLCLSAQFSSTTQVEPPGLGSGVTRPGQWMNNTILYGIDRGC